MKEKVKDNSRMPSSSASHDDRDSSGLKQSLDKEFGIPSIKTPRTRRIQYENRHFGSNQDP